MDAEGSLSEFREQRLENMAKLQEAGHAAFGQAFERTSDLGSLPALYEEGKTVRLAGRLVAKRVMGKSAFAHVQDATGKFQVYAKKDRIGEDSYAAFKILDLGDFVGAEGILFETRTGEQTVQITHWTLLSKALLPLPEKWHGLQDVETRYRQRYLDMVASPEVCKVFRQRSDLVQALRRGLWEQDFVEVETPMMQPMAGGAAATPFQTHYDALSCDMFLRIAPELYLKRLLVGGMDKVFELNRNFRNEGLSRSHNPEFTMLEIYQAYGDVQSMMQLLQGLVTKVAQDVFGTLQVGTEAQPVDLTPPWRTVTYRELIEEVTGPEYFGLSLQEKQVKAESLGCDVQANWSDVEMTQEIFEKVIEKTLINPTFVTRLPVELVPLAKACEDDGNLVDVFECIIGGKEIAPGYSELNDPIEQRKRFNEQADGDADKVDEDFLTAMEHGMPPAGGMGIGIDRLAIILTGVESIRDVILFPQLKPKLG